MVCKYGIIGPYIVHNFGDDLIGCVIATHVKNQLASDVIVPGLSSGNTSFLGATYSQSVLKTVMSADKIVIGGGGILGDSGAGPETRYLKRCLKAAILAKSLGKSVCITGVGAGPLSLKRSRYLCKWLCSLADVIGVRDEQSSRFLVDTIQVPDNKVVTGADLALLWPEMLHIDVIANKKIGIQYDVEGFVSSGDLQCSDIRSMLERYCTDNQSNVLHVSNGDYDTELYRGMDCAYNLLRYNSMRKYLMNLAGLRCILTTHLHLSIAAFAARVPCFSIYVRPKTKRFYEQIGRPERAIDIKDLNKERFQLLLHELSVATWTEKDEVARVSLCDQSRKLLRVI